MKKIIKPLKPMKVLFEHEAIELLEIVANHATITDESGRALISDGTIYLPGMPPTVGTNKQITKKAVEHIIEELMCVFEIKANIRDFSYINGTYFII